MKEIKFNIKYVLQRKELYITILAVLAINIFHVYLCAQRNSGWHITSLTSAEYQFILCNVDVALTSIIIIVFPILLSMIFSDSSFLENKRKTTNLLYMRLDIKKNIITRAILSFIITILICFVGFMVNYLLLILIYGSGNFGAPFQETAFLMESRDWFLDDIRLSNLNLYIVLISASVSIIMGLLSSLSYLISNFIKQKVIVYFVPLIFLLLWEVVVNFFDISTLSYILMLQPFSYYTLFNYMIACLVLVIMNAVLLTVTLTKKDILL